MKKQFSNLTRTGLFALALSLCAVVAQGQSKTVQASEIMDALKKGKEINYQNVTVEGVLDFTDMDQKMPDLPTKRRWWKNGGDNTVNQVIESKITFENVTFSDDVLAYFHDDRSEYTFTADFENDVTFKNCKFKRNAMFKYSEFERHVNFEGSEFSDDTTFKYAQFEEKVSFASTKFDEDAIFKYTKFREGVSFEDARFERSLDMKYTKVRGDFDTKGLYVRWDIDTKYTDINGRGFSKHMLDN